MLAIAYIVRLRITVKLQPTSAFLLFSLKFSGSTITTTIYVASLEHVLSLGKLQAFTNFQ